MGKFSYKIFSEMNLCYTLFSGDTNINHVYKSVDILTCEKGFHPAISSIIDLRRAKLFFQPDDAKNYVNYIKGNFTLKGERQVAFLTTTPQQTAHSIEYQALAKKMPMRVEVYTTLEACLKWCYVPIDNIELINEFIGSMNDN